MSKTLANEPEKRRVTFRWEGWWMFLTARAINHWNNLSRNVMAIPSLAIFKSSSEVFLKGMPQFKQELFQVSSLACVLEVQGNAQSGGISILGFPEQVGLDVFQIPVAGNTPCSTSDSSKLPLTLMGFLPNSGLNKTRARSSGLDLYNLGATQNQTCEDFQLHLVTNIPPSPSPPACG